MQASGAKPHNGTSSSSILSLCTNFHITVADSIAIPANHPRRPLPRMRDTPQRRSCQIDTFALRACRCLGVHLSPNARTIASLLLGARFHPHCYGLSGPAAPSLVFSTAHVKCFIFLRNLPQRKRAVSPALTYPLRPITAKHLFDLPLKKRSPRNISRPLRLTCIQHHTSSSFDLAHTNT